MSVRADLQQQLARFDDDAYIALANRGLLRRARKDLETQAVTVHDDAADALTLGLGELRIRFDARGPAHARCSCQASGVCQHILAAAIGLQRMGGTAPSPTPADELAAIEAALLAFTPQQLVAHAGRAGHRWAWQFVQDMDPQTLRLHGERHVLIEFTQPRMRFRFMGGGVEALVADAALAQIEKYQVAAVLAFQRARGVELQPPEVSPRTAALDLGRGHAPVPGAVESQERSRERLRASALQLFADSVELGLSHGSQGLHERFATLAVWAQGADYPRLALLLRRVADHIELLLERAAGADEQRLLDELALGFALVSALDAAAARGAAPVALVGRARDRYAASGRLELLGLGAHAWRTGSGYHGLTMLFWSPADQAFLSCSLARPQAQHGFDPRTSYRAAGPWAGVASPAQLSGRSLTLIGAQIGPTGRISTADGCQATASAGPVPLQDRLPVCDDWAALAGERSAARRSLLAEPDPLRDWAVLRPARFGRARFDAARQALVWPLFDAADRRLDAELAYSALNAHAIGRIEALVAPAAGTLLVAQVVAGERGLVVQPLSLVEPARLDVLHFDAAPDGAPLAAAHGAPGPDPASVAAIELPGALREVRRTLQAQAERGIVAERVAAWQQQWTAACGRAAAAGFTVFQRLRHDDARPGAVLLRAHWLCRQCEALLAPAESDD